jgi:SulP family sulfate permease
MHRMAQVVAVETGTPILTDDVADETGRAPFESEAGDTMVYRINGPLFFGASGTIATTLERIGLFPKTVILDLSTVPLADSSAAASLRAFVARARHNGAAVYVAGAMPFVRQILARQGLDVPAAHYTPTVAEARLAARQHREAEA